MTWVEMIYEFNNKAGLLDGSFNDALESSFLVEEALEGFDLDALAYLLDYEFTTEKKAKEISRKIVYSCVTELDNVDRIDKAADAVVFAIGSMFKLGLTSKDVEAVMKAVMESNLDKLGMGKDSEGKLLKPNNFVGPEQKIRKILNSI